METRPIIPAQLILATESGHRYSPYLAKQGDSALALIVRHGKKARSINIV